MQGGFSFDIAPAGAVDNRTAQTRAVKDLVRKQFGLDPKAPVFVAEVTCGEIDCPDAETVIAVYLEDGNKELKVAKPVSKVTGADIIAALTP